MRFFTIFVSLFLLVVLSTAAGIRYSQVSAEAIDSGCLGARAIVDQKTCGDSYGVVTTSLKGIGANDSFTSLINNNFKQCNGVFDATKADQSDFCTVGDQTASRSIVLIGDSHAEQYLNTFDQIGRTQHYKVYLFDTLNCTDTDFKDTTPACAARYDAIEQSKAILDKSSFVVISYLYRSDDYVAGQIHYIRGLTTNRHLVLFKDLPHTTEKLLNKCNQAAGSCTTPIKTATDNSDAIDKQLQANGDLDGVSLIDLDSALCDSTKCYSFVGGIPVYNGTWSSTDGVVNSHITATFSYSLDTYVTQKLHALHVL